MTSPSPLDLHDILPLVRKPGQYVGGELHAVSGDLDRAKINFCLLFPDLYEIGMSHQGLQILYHILNRTDWAVAHRAYVPDVDMEAELRRRGLPLFSLEARVGLAAYDAVGITLPHELCYTNILTALHLSGLPPRSRDRTAAHPLILGGGPCALNPEPVADFFDAIVLGDGEETIVDIAALLRQAKAEGWDRPVVLERLAEIAGVYVPALFRPRYEQDRLVAVEPLQAQRPFVRKRVLARLPDGEYLHRPLVPVVNPVHDRLAVEIARGCTRGCRFCQAGITYRPVRERSPEVIMALAEEGITHSGFEELALLSLSTGDYSCLSSLMTRLMNRFARESVSISMPSMRVGTLTPELMEEIRRVRKTGFTIAPEAGTDRLREVINKGVSEEDLLATCRDAFTLGWRLIKFYFMIGLPTETDADIKGIAQLARKARAQGGQGKGRPVQINIGVAAFVPKPHTPFQWEPQLSLGETRARLDRLKELLPRQGFRIKWHDPEQSFVEGVFARGDRRLSALLEAVWDRGARLDSWSEHFRLDSWREAAAACGLELERYLRKRELDEVLPWDHLHSGVDRAFLEEERERAWQRQYTPDCRVHGCQGCGLCDFKTVQPVVHGEHPAGEPPSTPSRRVSGAGPGKKGMRYRVSYTRLGDSRFYGHLEMLQLIFRTLRRTGLPVLFSQGFNPSPRVSFSQALPVGVESLSEYFDVELARPLPSMEAAMRLFNTHLPPSIRVTAVAVAPKKTAQESITSYRIGKVDCSEVVCKRIHDFLARDTYVIERYRKKRHTSLDLRPLVVRLEAGPELMLELKTTQGQPGTNPREILQAVLGLPEEEALRARILKTGVREHSSSS
ncbi:MAG: TIGR03960 family B12-binding radical SAM protein [Desulfobulbus sp.]|jgi:radical SAM family uncharacterized protein/radical SAM-linked protein